MKARKVKYKVNRMVKKFGSKQAVADKLDVTLRYIYDMLDGVIPGKRLYRDICTLYDQTYPKK